MARRIRRRQSEAGSALIEFALSAVLMLTVLLGVIDVGRALYAYDWLAHAARAGTRFAMVRGTQCTILRDGCPATGPNITAYIENTNGDGLDTTGIDVSQLTVNTTCLATGHANGPPPCAPQGWIQIKLAYGFQFLSPFAPFSWNMHSSSQRIVQR